MSECSLISNVDEPLTNTGGHGEKFAFNYRRIGPLIGLRKLGCSVYTVAPGKRAFPYHAHAVIEELFIILSGAGKLRQDGQEYPVRCGDVIAAPTGKAHQLINTSDADLTYMAISSNETTDVVIYPDSNKVMAYSEVFDEKLWHMTKRDDATDYYDGET